ncbi:MAG: molybdenum ABC transporter ATP-binding protein [Chromatiaceae bacterium]|nr:molybdenum ABC transporter ATP-binding protein [Chromatiaceae bacterium]MBP8282836.1 molybdenum ABC transporter ATP-binding protein [Chromatiaceae bacterium]
MQWRGFTLAVNECLPGRGVTALFGPSGSGKTSLLRYIAGLEKASQGRLIFKGEVWQDSGRGLFRPTYQRPLGYVFQEPSLFPHLSVRGNLDYGHKRAGGERRVALEPVVALLGIGPLLERDPGGLSGGERQRVAIARALATSPRLLLMDEPLAALDLKLKAEILPYLERLHDELEIPVLYVSHSPEEVARLADHILVLEAGQVRAAGPARDILSRLDLPLARDNEASSFLDGLVLAHDESYGLTRIQVPGASLWVPSPPRPMGARVRVRIQARDVSIALGKPGASSILNILPTRILEIGAGEGPRLLVKLGLGPAAGAGSESCILARITRQSRDLLSLVLGQEVYAQVKAVALME